MQGVKLHDVVAGLVALGMLGGIILLAVLQLQCPDELRNGFMLALGWLFRSGVQLQNDLRHRGRTDHGNGPNDSGGGGGQGAGGGP